MIFRFQSDEAVTRVSALKVEAAHEHDNKEVFPAGNYARAELHLFWEKSNDRPFNISYNSLLTA